MGAAGRASLGQASVEYALVLVAFLSMLVALSLLCRGVQESVLLRRAREASAHNAEDGMSYGLFWDLMAT